MANIRTPRKQFNNPVHLVLSTGEAHPPFIQEIAPGVIEKCVWDERINGYRCSVIQERGT